MRPEQILQSFVVDGLTEVHAVRRRAVADAVSALLDADSAIAADMGRAIALQTSPKHGIKRVDRLLGNRHLQSETSLFYRALALQILGPRPIILVDWTALCRGLDGLVAGVVHDGRALPIYAESHPSRRNNNTALESQFLDGLAAIIPPGSKPVIVTDAGYRSPWFRKVKALGWDFVGRLMPGGLNVRRLDDKDWMPIKGIINSSGRLQDHGETLVAKSNAVSGRLICLRCTPKKRSKGQPRAIGRKKTQTPMPKYRRRAHGSALFSTLLEADAQDIERIYRTRMQIEETFRSAKSHRFGWSLEDVFTESPARMNVTLLLTALAIFCQVLLGVVAEHRGIHKRYQANTTRKRRVISLFALGGMVRRRIHRHEDINRSWLQFGLDKLRQRSQSHWTCAR